MSPFFVLLRAPHVAARACITGVERRELTRTALVSLLLCGALFGATVGSVRGDLQILYAAIKLPLVLLGALVVTAPALWAFGATEDRPWPLRVVSSLVLVAAGRAALVLAAMAPLLWLALDLAAGYHLSAFLASGVLVLAALAGLGVLVRGLSGMARATLALAALVFLVGLAQFGWTLRPWLGRPGNDAIVFVRDERGVGVWSSVTTSAGHAWHDPSGDSLEGASW